MNAEPHGAQPHGAQAEMQVEMLPIALIEEGPNTRKVFAPRSRRAPNTSSQPGPLGRTRIGVSTPLARIDSVISCILAGSKNAGRQEIPAIVRDMSDLEVLEAQIVENSQRADIHPLEEAEAFEELHKKFGRTVEVIAHQVGKSAGYVYARLRLCALEKPAREAFYAGKLTPTTALLVARIPNAALQAEATKEIVREIDYTGDLMSAKTAADLVQRKYMLRLDQAPFKATEASLVPEAGACTTCHKRTGNQRELFADVKSGDMCTDPPCFQKKVDALWKVRSSAAKAAGQAVIEAPAAAKKLFVSYDSSRLEYNAPYVDLKSHCPQDPKNRTYGQLLGKKVADAVVLARDPAGGVHELLPKDGLSRALKAAGHDFKAAASSGIGSYGHQEKKRRAAAQLRRNVVTRSLSTIATEAELRAQDVVVWRMILGFQRWGQAAYQVRKRRGISDGDKALTKYLAGLTVPALLGLLVEMQLADLALGYSDYNPEFKEACSMFGIDIKALEAAAAPKPEKKKDAGKKPAAKPAVKAKPAPGKPKPARKPTPEPAATQDGI